MNKNKLVLKREYISNLNDNHMGQIKGGTFITSVWACTGFTWCNNCNSGNSCDCPPLTQYTCNCGGNDPESQICKTKVGICDEIAYSMDTCK